VTSGFGFPPGRLLVNLAPADMRKSGAGFDLAIALSLLATDEQIERAPLRDYVAVCDRSSETLRVRNASPGRRPRRRAALRPR
jgi:magnesium chelatase family protein